MTLIAIWFKKMISRENKMSLVFTINTPFVKTKDNNVVTGKDKQGGNGLNVHVLLSK